MLLMLVPLLGPLEGAGRRVLGAPKLFFTCSLSSVFLFCPHFLFWIDAQRSPISQRLPELIVRTGGSEGGTRAIAACRAAGETGDAVAEPD